MAAKRLAYIDPDCVACGCCLKACPFEAISIPTGTLAKVDADKCRGCGKCEKACPAGVIQMGLREGASA